MTSFSSLRIRLVGTVFLAMAPALVLMYFTHLEWVGFIVGVFALAAAWFGGEHFVLRQVRMLNSATRRLAAGDLSSRSGLSDARSELGQLAQTFDSMAESLQKRALESEAAETSLRNRALQQTVVAALGQFALISNDLNALLNQAVTMVSQTLDVDYCGVLELLPGGEEFILRAGTGWKDGFVSQATVSTRLDGQPGYTLSSGEPTLVENMKTEDRFHPTPIQAEHEVISSVTVAISTRQMPYGILGVHTKQSRKFTGDEVNFLLAVSTAVGMAVERNRAEAEMQKLAVFAQLNPNPAMELSADGNVTYFNDAALKLALSVHKDHPRSVLPPDVIQIITECLATGKSQTRIETQVNDRIFSWSFHPVGSTQIVHCYVEDITDRLSLEAQLRQSQKMESIGQLAAGVAHDFNNMLTIIQGHAGILMLKAGLSPKLFDSAQAIHFASERAASLTRQLLLFGRKNVIQMRPIDLRDAVSNMSKMLKRLLGETIVLEFRPPMELPLVNADSGMLEQVLMNLSVNARDAMPRGGTLKISMSAVEVNQEYAQGHPDARPGAFVCIRVADTGTGMTPATMSRIFEPFFTTKEVGKGTGLGLATVYGIVKQHGGWIGVESEVGKGSEFTVFLPATDEKPEDGGEATDTAAFVRGGTETILVVEDEFVLREMAHTILEESGYRILEAGNGPQALKVWEQQGGKIDLLLTDMVMPEGVSGVELAEGLLARQPQLRVLFTSGYTVDDVSSDYLVRKNAHFLQKPYTSTTLVRAVRRSLDSRINEPS